MIEIQCDLWEWPATFRVITTNGAFNKDLGAVMGRGCALEAKLRYPTLPKMLGERLRDHGNHVHMFEELGLITFPVKHHWALDADLELIDRSANELALMMSTRHAEGFCTIADHIETVVMPRPGCGNGRLSWDKVRPILDRYLDDNYVVVNK
jgi:hypothetical protein